MTSTFRKPFLRWKHAYHTSILSKKDRKQSCGHGCPTICSIGTLDLNRQNYRYLIRLQAVSWAFIGISTCATVGRYAIRYHDDRRFKWDDATHFIAFCFMFANVMVYQVTFDALYSDTLRAPFPVPSVIEPADEVHLFWLSIAQCMVGFLCLIFVKLSFLLYYHQIFKSSSTFKKWWWAVLAFALVSYGVDLAGCLTVCGPVQQLGNFTPSKLLGNDMQMGVITADQL